MCVCVCVLVPQLCPTLCDPMDAAQQAPLSTEFSKNTGVGGHSLLFIFKDIIGIVTEVRHD